MEHLKKKELDTLKALLLEERRRILHRLESLENVSHSELGDLSGDLADVASIEISQNALTKLGAREQRLVKKIDEALARMDDGSYGICKLTGEPIPYKRLLARPVAEYTVEAKEELERREKGFADRSEIEDPDTWGTDEETDD